MDEFRGLRGQAGKVLATVAVLVAVGWLIRRGGSGSGASGADASDHAIEFRGARIELSRSYATDEEYQDDPNKLPPASVAQVERLMTEARVRPTFPSREALLHELLELQFPGYGMDMFGEADRFSGFGLEIPGGTKKRYLVFREHDGEFWLVDDFVRTEPQPILAVLEQDGQLVYGNAQGETVARHTLRAVH